MADNKVKFLRGTSNEYAVAEKDSDTIYFTTDDGKLYIGDKEVSGDGSITIDNTLSDTSTNPVQNKVVKQAIDNKADKTVATTSTDGLMSAEDKTKLDNADNTYALKSKYGDSTINIGRKAETTVGEYSTAEGINTTASGTSSHAEGWHTTASGTSSHAEGYSSYSVMSVITDFSSSTSNSDIVSAWNDMPFTLAKNYSHSEGYNTLAIELYSHAEGVNTIAMGRSSHAEGWHTTASGNYSHAEGYYTTASGLASHAGGTGTKALHNNEVAYGKYNESNDNTLFSIGDGTADDARHNAFEITTTGGKLHDKDIATTDLIPTTLPANGGNADTVGGVGITNLRQITQTVINTLPAAPNGEGDFFVNRDEGDTSFPYKYGHLSIRYGSYADEYVAIFRTTGNDNKVYYNTYLTDHWSGWINVADGGNADTVDGLHANDFTQIIDFGFSETDTKTAIGQSGKTTIYRCTKWTDYPSGCSDGQGTVIAINYSGAGTAGVNTMWVTQIFLTAHGDGPLFHIRCVDATNVGKWKEISTTPIKKISFSSVATNSGGGGGLFSADFGTPIAIACTSRADIQCTSFFANNQWLVLAKDAVTLDPIPAGSYSFDVWYI